MRVTRKIIVKIMFYILTFSLLLVFFFFLKTQTSHQTSVDECRRMQTSYRRTQTNVDECRRVTRQVQTNVDECGRIKNFYFDSRKSDAWSWAPFSYCCNYATVSRIGKQIFNFIVLSLITAYYSVLTPHISKTPQIAYFFN